ncbi:MAG TPA: SBBP repeat-containing protein [Myxococcus sp.]|nr:SBBP repeat-containing protein [Myxococcus sp.]
MLGVLSAASAKAEEFVTALPPVWQQSFGTSGDELALAVAASQGNVYTAGYTTGMFGLESVGGQDVFVTNHDAQGTLLWVRQLGSPAHDRAVAMTADPAGNVYVTGYTWGSLVTGVPNRGGTDIFVAKYNAQGERLWVRQLGTEMDDFGTGVAVRRNGQDGLVVAGYSLGRFDSSASPGNYDVVVVKFDQAGNEYWRQQFGTGRSDVALGVALGDSEDIYIAGHTQGSLDGVTSPGTTVDLFVACYGLSGHQRWVRQLGSTSDEYGTGVAVRRASPEGPDLIYVSGYTFGALDGNVRAGSYDAVLVKYDGAGNRQWTRQLGTTTSDYAQGVAVDDAGNVHLAGYTAGSLAGNPSLGGTDLFAATYDAEGRRLATHQAGTPGTDRGQGVATSSDGALYLVGYTWTTTSSGANHYDGLLIRY